MAGELLCDGSAEPDAATVAVGRVDSITDAGLELGVGLPHALARRAITPTSVAIFRTEGLCIWILRVNVSGAREARYSVIWKTDPSGSLPAFARMLRPESQDGQEARDNRFAYGLEASISSPSLMVASRPIGDSIL